MGAYCPSNAIFINTSEYGVGFIFGRENKIQQKNQIELSLCMKAQETGLQLLFLVANSACDWPH